LDKQWAKDFMGNLIGKNERECSKYLINKILHPDNGVNLIEAFWSGNQGHDFFVELCGGEILSIALS
jgi:hypothetical protein